MLFDRSSVAEFLETRRGAGAPSHRVDHQIRRHGPNTLAAAHLHPGDPAAVGCRRQVADVMSVEEGDVRDGADASPDMVFEQRPTRHVGGSAVAEPARGCQPVPTEDEVHLRQVAVGDHRCAIGDQVVEDAGEQLVHGAGTAGQEPVAVPPLRYPVTVLCTGREDVAFDHCHRVVGLGQRAGREQTTDARAQNDCVVTDLVHLVISVARSTVALRACTRSLWWRSSTVASSALLDSESGCPAAAALLRSVP